jgi:hypothetical protein
MGYKILIYWVPIFLYYQLPIDVSLKLFECLHLRWCVLLEEMEPQ